MKSNNLILNGWLPDKEPPKEKYLAKNITEVLQPKEQYTGVKNWYSKAWNPTQPNGNSQCLSYSFLNVAHSDPHNLRPAPYFSPDILHHQSQLLDGYPLPHEGTGIHACARASFNLGLIGDYYWTHDVMELVDFILKFGPAVVGGTWDDNMCNPVNRHITTGGKLVGGHATEVTFANLDTELIMIKNTFGNWYGPGHYVSISFEHMQKFMDRDAMACLPMKNKSLRVF